ncbi:hypothetical protein B0H19DRAFT_170101 [Mycena capillaripes]|nr:hypothetical protein B0H19DRAFT_170101 [Mycena capillaripes]
MTRFFVVLLFLFGATSFAGGAAVRETNGSRLAKGLPPLPPRWVPTRTRIHRESRPSPSPSPSNSIATCRAGNIPLCCSSTVPANDPAAAFLLKLLGAATTSSDLELVAITCSPLGSRSCAHKVVCCDHDEFDGVIATGCTVRRGRI